MKYITLILYIREYSALKATPKRGEIHWFNLKGNVREVYSGPDNLSKLQSGVTQQLRERRIQAQYKCREYITLIPQGNQCTENPPENPMNSFFSVPQ